MHGPDFDRMSKDEVIAWIDPPLDPGFEMVVRTGSMAPVSVWLPAPMVDALDRVADARRAPRADVVRQALTAYLDL